MRQSYFSITFTNTAAFQSEFAQKKKLLEDLPIELSLFHMKAFYAKFRDYFRNVGFTVTFLADQRL